MVLALGIGVNTAVFSLVNAMLLRPVAGVSADRLAGVFSRDRTKPGSYRGFSYPEYRDLRDGSEVFEGLLAQNFALLGLREGDTTRRAFAGVVSSNYFQTLGVRLARGRAFSPEEEAPGAEVPVVVVSHAFWKKTGPDPDLVGKSVRLNEREFTVVGVAPEGFSGTTALFSPEVWIPLGMYDATLNDFQRHGASARLGDRRHRNLVLAGLLRPGLTRALAESSLRMAGERLAREFPAENGDQELSLAPLGRLGISTEPQPDQPAVAAAALLMAMASLVLLIACLNLANMMLARGEARRKEIAVRLALGASRHRIVRQLLTEGLALALLGGGAGLCLAYEGTRLLVASLEPLAPLAIVFPAAPDPRVLLATLVFSVMATLLFGLGPAWTLSKADALPHLKEQAGEHPGTSGRRRLLASRNLLVTTQVALSLALLATGGLFLRGALAASRADPGFSLDRGLLVEVDPALAGDDEARGRNVYASVLEQLRSLRGVEAVAAASTVPFGPISTSRRVQRAGEVAIPGGAEPGNPAQYVVVGADYFRALGLPLLRGRDFTPGEEAGGGTGRVAVINEPLARTLFPGEDALGRQIQLTRSGEGGPSEPFEVVGVAPGLRHDLFDPAPVPHVYVPFGSHYQSGMSLHVRVASGDPAAAAAVLATVRETLRAAAPRLPILSATTLAAYCDASLPLWMVRTGARVFSLFGGLALFLAVVGVYGVKAYVVARRTREIGIRMALGATRAAVLRLVLGEGLLLTGIGLGAGLLLSLLAGRLVSRMLYQVAPADPLVLASASALLAAAALLAAYLPARRATRVAPVTALRHE